MFNSAQTLGSHGTTNVIALKAELHNFTCPTCMKQRKMIWPQFGSPFSELANGRKLTDEELVRAIRFMVAAEYEATQMYMQLAESTENKLAVAVLTGHSGRGKLLHAGEFLKLLYELAPMKRRSMQGGWRSGSNHEITTSEDKVGSAGTQAGGRPRFDSL